MPASLPTANDKADFEIRRILQKIYEKHHDDKGRAKVTTPARSTALAGEAEQAQHAQQQQQAEEASASSFY